MTELNSDKMVERDRYNSRFANAFNEYGFKASFGAGSIAPYLRAPYVFYEELIKNNIKPEHKVLELGSGSGLHTEVLLKTGAYVTASDIAPSSLMLLQKSLIPRYGEKLATQVADMESLTFEDGYFDAVTSAGSLSYGDPELVNREIKRVLKPGGIFICVDSLNHNPIYRFNRYLQFRRGQRTISTLERMPDMQRIKTFEKLFNSVEVSFFGSVTWAAPIFTCILGQDKTTKFFDAIDRFISVKQSAFKFVMIATNKFL